MKAFIAFGSNLGDRLGHFIEAKRRLRACGSVSLTMVSSVYEAEAVECQPSTHSFYNAVVEVDAERAPHELLAVLQGIEEEMGRAKSRPRNVPRRIDLDLLCCDDLILNDADLILPHPRMTERRFVLLPLAEIRPDYIVPGTGKTASQLLAELEDPHWIRKLAAAW